MKNRILLTLCAALTLAAPHSFAKSGIGISGPKQVLRDKGFSSERTVVEYRLTTPDPILAVLGEPQFERRGDIVHFSASTLVPIPDMPQDKPDSSVEFTGSAIPSYEGNGGPGGEIFVRQQNLLIFYGVYFQTKTNRLFFAVRAECNAAQAGLNCTDKQAIIRAINLALAAQNSQAIKAMHSPTLVFEMHRYIDHTPYESCYGGGASCGGHNYPPFENQGPGEGH